MRKENKKLDSIFKKTRDKLYKTFDRPVSKAMVEEELNKILDNFSSTVLTTVISDIKSLKGISKPKMCNEMTFNEFSQWAKEVIVKEFLKSGLDGISTGLFIVLNQAAYNKVFGGGKNAKAK